ncbi:MAG TPA: arylamine N-acetyltransferase [Candidatus Dormibacteraeota bacterium]|jgi:N-hydroxyarylamine O-acetyltransferase|nr:arylamine N-acetyltransferase [Candidatus Dormibacteraeota bacterium]
MSSEWEIDRLDLDAYLDRIGLEEAPPPTPRGLRRLHRAHTAAIPFENLDIMLGRPIRLELDALQDKLVTRRRGGYCYEHNLLFAAALERRGLRVTRLSARVRMGATSIRPQSHMLLRVEAEGIDWLADVGFGGEGLLDPLPLADGAVTAAPGWNHSLGREDERVWVLRSLHPDGWLDLYGFTLDPQHRIDYEVFNHYVATHPRSPFTQQVIAQRSTPEWRLTLTGLHLAETRPDFTETVTELDPNELAGTLRERFGIPLDDDEAALLRDRAQAERASPASPSIDVSSRTRS